ncbi:MAG TPA: hypothetical protein VIO64_21005 [Pseudobacteroides sp.]|uniref:hypothetical protein n=1 Tax=Pseudobacteroides sp. TaxID=1968840 RepID=UPI002F93CACE
MLYFDRNYMQMTGMPAQVAQVAAMPQERLEEMYPTTYNIIQPAVESTCDMVANTYGQMFTPNRKQLESMIDEVYNKVEGDVEAATKEGTSEGERQFYGGGRRVLRDFIGALLIGSLIRRRRPFHYGYPGYFGYPGYYGGFGGFPY